MKISKKELFKFCDDNNDAINELQSQSDSTNFLLAVLIQQLKDSGVIDEISPEPKPQLKQLDQSVFKNMHERWRFAAIDADGSAHRFNKLVDFFRGEFVYEGDDSKEFKFSLIGKGYDTSNWQNSLIERDTAKELTGSDLAGAMLARGDKYVMCQTASGVDVISGTYEDGYFVSLNGDYAAVTPINNQGEPLTASEAGF